MKIKTINFFKSILVLFALVGVLMMVSCGDDEPVSSCTDGIKNGSETGIDCGGDCTACATCNDGMQNGTEIDVDCGGDCPDCPTCIDGIQNGIETGVDCGGDCGYCIGDIGPGGGIVFYDNGESSSGWRYLESSTSDQNSLVSWGANDEFVGMTSGAIGAGFENTNWIGSQGVAIPSAILTCVTLNSGGKSDWYLPSTEELRQMYLNRDIIGGFVTNEAAYWSSTEGSLNVAWLLSFSTSNLFIDDKVKFGRVRAIRRFR